MEIRSFPSPDGKNINENCGALHPETVARAVAGRRGEFDLGVTFDGDADRALFSDADGRVVNGDGVLLLAARDLKARNGLAGSLVVATTMSNMGLEIALRNSGVRMLRANVGDKYVLEEMLKSGATLGGEQSGHVIFRDGESTTGDGLLTALRVMEIMARTGKALVAAIKAVRPMLVNTMKIMKKPSTFSRAVLPDPEKPSQYGMWRTSFSGAAVISISCSLKKPFP
jgi:phosphoglucosamine mutase